jgi:sterol desaturase/sphingolipid hydroxylase (fatty acid hydroxylase superfamily)
MKKSKLFIVISLLSLGVALWLLIIGKNEWGIFIVFTILAFQQSNFYLEYKKSEDQKLRAKAAQTRFIAILMGSVSLMILVANLFS